jgi:hypothetical protein
LVTARLRLRAFRPGDLDAYAAMRANPRGHAPYGSDGLSRGSSAKSSCSLIA